MAKPILVIRLQGQKPDMAKEVKESIQKACPDYNVIVFAGKDINLDGIQLEVLNVPQ